MPASIQPIFTWGQDRVFVDGARVIVLLVEWEGISSADPSSTKSRKIVAHEIELRIWLEPYVSFNRCYGGGTESGEGRSLLLKLGKIHSGQRKYIALEFTVSAMPAGKHEALWMQWQYKQPSVERIRELPVKKLGLQYTRHTSMLGTSLSFHVEKHLELLKSAEILEKTVTTHSDEQFNLTLEHLRRQADKLLLLATRSGDVLLLKEAERVYKKIDLNFNLTINNL